MNNEQLEAMLRLIQVAWQVKTQAQREGQFGLAFNIQKDIKILAEYGANATATTDAEKYRLFEKGVLKNVE